MRAPAILNPAMIALRGPYKSIRYQWITLPKERITYFWYRLTGRSWIEFYRARLNTSSAASADVPPPAEYVANAANHLEFLIENGLMPSHRFLDIGCGVLRTAKFVVPYLDPGNYVGTDISSSRVRKGQRFVMRAAGIPDDRYSAVIVDNPQMRELGQNKFDVIWANSVLTHMPESDIRALLASIKNNMAPGCMFFFSFSERETYLHMGIKDFFHPRSWMRSLCEEYGFEFSIIDTDVVTPSTMARLHLRTDTR